jgi:hypothetical protein
MIYILQFIRSDWGLETPSQYRRIFKRENRFRRLYFGIYNQGSFCSIVKTTESYHNFNFFKTGSITKESHKDRWHYFVHWSARRDGLTTFYSYRY